MKLRDALQKKMNIQLQRMKKPDKTLCRDTFVI